MNAVLSAISTASPALNASAAPMVWVAILSATGAQNLTNPRLTIPAAKARLRSASNQSGGACASSPRPLEQGNEIRRGENLHPRRGAGALQLPSRAVVSVKKSRHNGPATTSRT